MHVEEAIAAIEGASDLDQLKSTLQSIAESYGFACFNFLDVGNPHQDVPFYFGTTGEAWESDYKSHRFVHVDHCVKFARRTNTPFVWDEVPLPHFASGPKPGALKIMDAAKDHGFENGVVVPFHYRDRLGRINSSLCVFYWKDTISRFRFMLMRKKIDLHVVLVYWVQRAVDVIAEMHRDGARRIGPTAEALSEVPLTDRERDILAWAGRGKTVAETADILGVGEETVKSHLRNGMRKLGATNKTHAAVRALYLGLIDY
jgi:DNA-binding CsgD family transcriptional regulator